LKFDIGCATTCFANICANFCPYTILVSRKVSYFFFYHINLAIPEHLYVIAIMIVCKWIMWITSRDWVFNELGSQTLFTVMGQMLMIYNVWWVISWSNRAQLIHLFSDDRDNRRTSPLIMSPCHYNCCSSILPAAADVVVVIFYTQKYMRCRKGYSRTRDISPAKFQQIKSEIIYKMVYIAIVYTTHQTRQTKIIVQWFHTLL